jgi:cobalt/nickel transport system permease protein
MHIPDAYLSPATEAAAFGVMVPIWAIAARRTAADLTSKQAPLLSIGAAFCFAIQMFNIPAIGGTTAHALGATLLAILVGRWAAVLGMTLTLAIQALLFGDGGILSLGANCFNMAFVASFVGYGVYRLCAGRNEFGSPRALVAAAIGAYAGTVTASLSAGFCWVSSPRSPTMPWATPCTAPWA